jgi:hypothetical protein
MSDIYGRVVFAQAANSNDGIIKINTESLMSGVYFVQISSELNHLTYKVIKN